MEFKGKNYVEIVTANPVGSDMVHLVEGISGYRRIEVPNPALMITTGVYLGDDADTTSRVITTDIPEPVVQAFLNGSMFGWQVKGADPYYCEKSARRLAS